MKIKQGEEKRTRGMELKNHWRVEREKRQEN
jgi:hypothetical protein